MGGIYVQKIKIRLESTDSTRCELVRGGLTPRAKPPQGTSARTRRGRSARRHNPTNQPTTKMCGTKEIILKNVRDKGNPIEKCAGQRKSYRKMCGTKEILLKSWKKPHNLSPILAPAPGTPGNPGKNLTICGPSPGPPEILEKTSQSEPHPLDLRKSWKKPHNITDLLGCCCCSDKRCRGPLRVAGAMQCFPPKRINPHQAQSTASK